MNEYLSSKGIAGTGGVSAGIMAMTGALQGLHPIANPRWYLLAIALLIAVTVVAKETDMGIFMRTVNTGIVTLALMAATIGVSRGQYDLRQIGVEIETKAEARVIAQDKKEKPTPKPAKPKPFDPL